jgi:hypothetical protein
MMMMAGVMMGVGHIAAIQSRATTIVNASSARWVCDRARRHIFWGQRCAHPVDTE